jgi:hypothetical protein
MARATMQTSSRLAGIFTVAQHQARVKYPATLITTADHDDRLFPAHSFKYAATLQEKAGTGNPVVIRIETKSATEQAVQQSRSNRLPISTRSCSSILVSHRSTKASLQDKKENG